MRTVPHRDDPDHLSPHTIEEAIWGYDQLMVRELREFGDQQPGNRKPLEPLQHRFRAVAKMLRGPGLVAVDIRNGGKELSSRGRSEKYPHRSVFGQKLVGFGQDRLQFMSLSCCDFFFPLRQ